MKNKRWQNIRNSIVMLCVMLAMLSTVTYAWFTLTDSPTVTGLQMTARAADGLQVCATSDGTFAAVLDLNDTQPRNLSPVTVVNNTPAFAEPVYNGNVVSTVNELTGLTYDQDNGYVLKYTYWLQTTSGQTVNVGLMGGTGTDTPASGSFVKRKPNSQNTATEDASAAIRIGFKVGNVWKIYEPNTNVTSVGTVTSATNSYNATFRSDVQQNTNGTFATGASANNATITEGLFSVGSTPVQVDMYVWLEGTDAQCVDQIQTDVLMGQIQFTIVE